MIEFPVVSCKLEWRTISSAQDDELTKHDCRPLWYELEMPKKREQIRDMIKARVDNGTYTDFLTHYKEVLLPYPIDMRVMGEGQEAYEWDIEDHAGDEDTDSNPGTDPEFKDAEGGDDGPGGVQASPDKVLNQPDAATPRLAPLKPIQPKLAHPRNQSTWELRSSYPENNDPLNSHRLSEVETPATIDLQLRS